MPIPSAEAAFRTALVAVLVLGTGCSRLMGGSRTLTLTEGTQGTYGDLRIGVGVIAESGGGKEPSAEIWLYYRGDSSKDTQINARVGRRVEVGKYAFLIETIQLDAKRVRIRFETDP